MVEEEATTRNIVENSTVQDRAGNSRASGYGADTRTSGGVHSGGSTGYGADTGTICWDH